MSALYVPVLVAHVLVAVLGVGSVAAVAIVAGAARRGGPAAAVVLPWLAPLLRYSSFSLATMLVTGVLLDLIAHGAFHERWWLRGSALLLIAIGVLLGQARRALRKGLSQQSTGQAALERVERMAYAMCGLVGAIVVLMEVKPF